MITSSSDYQLLEENEMLRQSLVAFLQLDIQVARQREERAPRSFCARLIQRVMRKTELVDAELLEKRKLAHEEYEFMRKLVKFDSKLLAVRPS